MTRFLKLAVFATFVTLCGVARAESGGDPLLTVTMDDMQIVLTRAQLEEIDNANVETTTIWTEGAQSFTGVSLFRLMEELGVSEGTLLASAINDYTVEVPVSDAVEGGPIIAYQLNGSHMSVRDKGPLWLVYPYDGDPKYQSEVIYSRSIWQLDRIVLVP